MGFQRTTVFVIAARIIGRVVSLVGLAFLAGRLGASVLGSFFLFQMVVGLLSLPANFGINGAVKKRLSQGDHGESTLVSALLFKAAIGILVSLVVVLVSRHINAYIGADVAWFVVVALLTMEAAKVFVQTLHGEQRVAEAEILWVIRDVLWIGLSILTVLAGWGLRGLVVAIIVGNVVVVVVAVHRMTVGFGRPSLARIRSLFDFAKHNFFTGVGVRLFSWLDVAVIGFLLTQHHVGIYEIAWKVSAIPMLVTSGVVAALFPRVSEWNETGDRESIEASLSTALLLGTVVTIPALFGIAVFAEPILGTFFGSEFAGGWIVLTILAGQRVLYSVAAVISSYLQATDNPDYAAFGIIAGVVSNVVLNPIMVVGFGIVGAAIATGLSTVVVLLFRTRYLARILSIEIPVREISWCTAAGAIMATVLLGYDSLVQTSTVVELALGIVVGAAVYLVAIMFYAPLRVELASFASESLGIP